MDISKMLKEITKELEPQIVKTIPMKAKWKKKHQEAIQMIKQMEELHSKLLKNKKAFWDMIEKEGKVKGKDLRYNEEKNVIEVLK